MRRYMAAVEVTEDGGSSTVRNVELSAKNHNTASAVAIHVARTLWPEAKSYIIDSIARLKKGGTPVSPVKTGDDGMLYVAPTDVDLSSKSLAVVNKPLEGELVSPPASKVKAVDKRKKSRKALPNFPNLREMLPTSVLKQLAETDTYKKYDVFNEGTRHNLWQGKDD